MKKIIPILFVMLLFASTVSAFFPVAHKHINDELMNTYQGTSDFYDLCVEYPDLCYTGNVLTDLSVVYYFVEQGVKYEVTHSAGFCVNMMANAVGDEEKACAIGSCLHHTQDQVSHNQMVPYAIEHTGMSNAIIHVFAEQKLDNYVVKKDPTIKNKVVTLGPESWEKCRPLIKRTLAGYSEYGDVDSAKLDEVINVFIDEVRGSIDDGTGYDMSFENKVSVFGKFAMIPLPILVLLLGSTALWLTLTLLLIFRKGKSKTNWISIFFFGILFTLQTILLITAMTGDAFTTFVSYITPFSNLVPLGASQGYIDQSIHNGYEFFDGGEGYITELSASGFEKLGQADESVLIFNYFLIAVVLGLLAFLIYWNFKKKKKTGGLDFKF